MAGSECDVWKLWSSEQKQDIIAVTYWGIFGDTLYCDSVNESSWEFYHKVESNYTVLYMEITVKKVMQEKYLMKENNIIFWPRLDAQAAYDIMIWVLKW